MTTSLSQTNSSSPDSSTSKLLLDFLGWVKIYPIAIAARIIAGKKKSALILLNPSLIEVTRLYSSNKTTEKLFTADIDIPPSKTSLAARV